MGSVRGPRARTPKFFFSKNNHEPAWVSLAPGKKSSCIMGGSDLWYLKSNLNSPVVYSIISFYRRWHSRTEPPHERMISPEGEWGRSCGITFSTIPGTN